MTIDTEITKVEKELNIVKFHWSETSWPVKIKFFNKVVTLPFTFVSDVFNNPINQEKVLESFIFKILKNQDIEVLYIDGAKPRWYASRLKKLLRDHGISIKR